MNYEIDRNDLISFVSPDFEAFAAANDAPELTRANVLGKPLFSYIHDPATAEIYGLLLRRVRSGLSTSFKIRCDSPDTRRLLKIRLTARGDRHVEFSTITISSEPRPGVALLAARTPRNDELVCICSWCARVVGPAGSWHPVEAAVAAAGFLQLDTLPRVTHGICPMCLATMEAEVAS